MGWFLRGTREIDKDPLEVDLRHKAGPDPR
jgi:hypothetical protein